MEDLLPTTGHAPAQNQRPSWDAFIQQLDEEWLLKSIEDARDALIYSEDVPDHVQSAYCCLGQMLQQLRSRTS